METGRCICHSEQGTRIRGEADVCAEIVAYGIYNPFKEPHVSNGRPQYEAERPTPKAGAVAATDNQPGRKPDTLPGITARDTPRYPVQSFPVLGR
jgi:hypothetical protein